MTQPLAPHTSRLTPRLTPPPERINPSVASFGRGPAACMCGSCANLGAIHIPTVPSPALVSRDSEPGRNQESFVQTLYYCLIDQGPKRVSWPACSRFREAPLPTWPSRRTFGGDPC